MTRHHFGRLAGSLLFALAVAIGASGCLLVPVPAPVAGPAVIVAPRPRPVFVPRPVYGPYRPHYWRSYGWSR
jgi:hypothetical protein